MKVFSVLIVVLLFSLSLKAQEDIPMAALEQRITLDVTNKTIQEILLQLEDNKPYSFSYVNSEIPLNRLRTVSVKDTKLALVLDQLFENTLINYIGYEDQIVLVRKDDIEVLEEAKQTQKSGYYYLPDLSEYSSINEGKGKYVNLDRLLQTIIDFYSNSVRNQEQIVTEVMDSVIVDSVYTNREKDSLLVNTKRKKKKLFRFGNISFENLNITYGFSGEIASNFWTFSSKDGNNDYNENSKPDLSFSLNGGLFLEGDHTITSLEMQYTFLQKTGIHTNFLINTIRPDTTLTRKEIYSEDYHFLEVPIRVAFKIPGRKITYLVRPGIMVQRLLKSTTADNYRTYQPQYFTNLNLNSSANPDLSPYFDQNFNIIEPKAIQIRKWNIHTSISVQMVTKLNDTWKFIIGPHIQYALFSLYDTNAPITQHRIQAGINITLSPVLPYM